ncbi:MAG: maleylpyruvate isomerase family mycothiol-dependent enzyme [Actinomycetota bacterium]
MSSRTQTISNLETCFQAIEDLIDSLSDEDWTVQSLCPAWDVKGVIGHLVGIENALSGWIPEGEGAAPPFDTIPVFQEQAAAGTTEQLIADAKRIFTARRDDLAASTDDLFATASMTPVGPGTYHRFMDIRTFDFWVHERDITTPLGRPTDDGGPVAEIALDEVHNSIGYIVGKKIGLPDGKSIAIHLTGPIERDIFAMVDGRAAKVDSLSDPSVELTTDSLTFVQLACGRIDPDEVIEAGRITWTGDDAWGETAAKNLRFTM